MLFPIHILYMMHHYLVYMLVQVTVYNITYPIQRIQFETQHTSEMLPDGEETIIHQSLQ